MLNEMLAMAMWHIWVTAGFGAMLPSCGHMVELHASVLNKPGQ